MATIEAVTPRVYAGTPRRGPVTRLLEDERWLASFLLMPTILLLVIASPAEAAGPTVVTGTPSSITPTTAMTMSTAVVRQRPKRAAAMARRTRWH